MKLISALVFGLITVKAFAIPCDCEVQVYSPITGPQESRPNVLKNYQLEEYGSYSFKNQKECRVLCLKKYEEDMPGDRLHALLLGYAQNMINDRILGYNCTGLTTLKFPVRVRAKLGSLGLGNVSDVIHVVNHEEVCF